MMEQKVQREEAFVGVLVLLSLASIITISVTTLTPDWLFTLFVGDVVICVVFAWDFAQRLRKAPEKLTFLKYHGFEVLAIVPAIVLFAGGQSLLISAGLRSLRLIRVIYVLGKDVRLLQSAQKFFQRSRLLFP